MQNKKSKELKCCKKDAILQAAEEVFIQKGYDGARMVEIAKRAGVGHPLLHYHFRNKEMLFQQVVKRKFNILSQALWVVFEEKSHDIRVCISIMVSSHFDFVQQHCNYIRFIANELEMHPELFQVGKELVSEQFLKTTAKLQCVLDEAAAKGDIRPMNATDLIWDVISLNSFSIWAKPLFNNLSENWDEKQFLETRKSENIKMILGRLQPNHNPYIE